MQDKDSIYCKKGDVVLPKDMSGVIKDFTIEAEYTMFKVYLKNPVMFAGNEVTVIEQWTGHENGIWGTSLVLKEKSMKEVNNNIKKSGVVFKKEPGMDDNPMGAEVVKGADDKIRIMCDVSN